MSYCRWSTDDFRCDLYIYDSCYENTVVHVARYRHTIPDEVLPPPVDLVTGKTGDWYARSLVVQTLMDQYPRRDIGGPLDGQTFTFDNADEVADWIETTVAPLGVYCYPDDLVDNLRAGNG